MKNTGERRWARGEGLGLPRLQPDGGLDVVGLGEEVHQPEVRDFIVFDEGLEIPGKRCGVAGYVNQPPGPVRHECGNDRPRKTGPGRIDDYRVVCTDVRLAAKEVAVNELHTSEAVYPGIFLAETDGRPGPFENPHGNIRPGRGKERKVPRSPIEIHNTFGGFHPLGHEFGKPPVKGPVGLKKGVGVNVAGKPGKVQHETGFSEGFFFPFKTDQNILEFIPHGPGVFGTPPTFRARHDFAVVIRREAHFTDTDFPPIDFPQASDDTCQVFGEYPALRNRNNLFRAPLEETGFPVSGYLERHPITVSVGPIDEGFAGLRLDTAKTAQNVPENVPFPPDLVVVGDILTITAPAEAEMRTGRINAGNAGCEEFVYLGKPDAAFFPNDTGAQPVTRIRARNENHAVGRPGKTVAPVGRPLDYQIKQGGR